ncbi:MAG TPA: molybdate ABC transporter substrate-binding protein [Thermoanaerobaculia bacterium]|nr:molybdate ABC transporter substrate-binding protein [Thermoanaerobaculia bacterium]
MRVSGAAAGLFIWLAAFPARGQEILVFAAASLTESLEEIGKAYQAKTVAAVRFSFGASSDLARQIAAGAPADVFFSADTAKMDTLEKAGLVRREDRREFLSNRLVVVVARDSARKVNGPRDLRQFGRIALADPAAVPAGIYAKKWLESAGVWREVEDRVVPTLDVRAALAAVESGTVEAAVVYKTDAQISRKVRPIFQTDTDPPILYSAGVVGRAGPAAREFLAFLQGKEARAAFTRAGFLFFGKE